jgi:hypothetical protein
LVIWSYLLIMPHIAGYIKEALEEEKYGEEFNSKIGK